MNESLLYRMRPVARRLRGLRFWQSWALLAMIAAGLAYWFRTRAQLGIVDGQWMAQTLAVVSVAIALIAAVVCCFLYRDPRAIAGRIERRFPTLDQRLLTALGQRDDRLGYLQQRVVKEARDHSRANQWSDAVSGRSLWLSRLSGLGATVMLAFMLGLLASTTPNRTGRAVASVGAVKQPTIQPGDTEVERGTSLVVTARFPDDALAIQEFNQGELVVTDRNGNERILPMTQSLQDPILSAFVTAIDGPLTYSVRTPFWSSREFTIDVFEYPDMTRSDVDITYPAYTGMSPRRVEDTIRVSAVEGSQLSWQLTLNKPVAAATLVTRDGQRFPLSFSSGEPTTGTFDHQLDANRRYTVELLDTDGRKNKYPPELVVRALPNLPPKLKVTPSTDSSVSPLQEFPIEAEVADDFKIVEIGFALSVDGGERSETILQTDAQGTRKATVEQMVALEDLDARPDQLLSYHFFASDIGPDGQRRRTESDMYFLEVRPFDEIFREGEPPPGGQGPPSSAAAAEAEDLAELQKEIINATWRVVRDSRTEKKQQGAAGTAGEAIELLAQSQSEAIEKLDELAAKTDDAKSQAFVAETKTAMSSALAAIESALTAGEARQLGTAVPYEQAAYAGLLKLRAREFQVSRSKQQPSQSSGSAAQKRKQRKLDELELDQDENRYETQSQAQPTSAEEAAQQAVRQTLSRLKDLARRQEDLNEEVAQLQSALEKAESEEEREEIERQLKRLRDQQQDLLRETDELADQMQQSPTESKQEGEPEMQQKLQETRENVRKATEALEQNDASEALASGKRAERQFEELRDEFRKQAAGQFDEAVRQLRNDAQELDEQQKELVEQLNSQQSAEPSPGLRPDSSRKGLEEQISQQRQSLDELLQQMQETVTDAEDAEPLLAQKLYDSHRKAMQQGADRKLEEAAQWMQRGMNPQAGEATQQAAEAVEELRKDLEEAAETVLGDESKALEKALGELDRLDDQLQKEIESNRPAQPGEGKGQPSGQRPPEGDEGEASEGSGRPSQPGQPPGQPGQSGQPPGQPGQPSRSEGQPGRPQQPGRSGGASQSSDASETLSGFGGRDALSSPLTGDGYRQWSDTLREIEEMVGDPELRSRAAQIRDRARDVRIDVLRHSKEPKWEFVQEMIADPLQELRRSVSEALMRRSAERNAAVPIDRDPVPDQFSDAVRRYYERLGSGR